MNEVQKQIDELAFLMEEHKIVKMEYSSEKLSLCFSKVSSHSEISPISEIVPITHFTPPFQEIQDTSSNPNGIPVPSPLTGIFYATSDPQSPPFVKSGEHVSQGQVIGLVEAMKVFNEILAPYAGIVSEYCVSHGQLVDLNDPLIYILASDS